MSVADGTTGDVRYSYTEQMLCVNAQGKHCVIADSRHFVWLHKINTKYV